MSWFRELLFQFEGLDDEQKEDISRRAFGLGMVVTSTGLFLPRSARVFIEPKVVDLARASSSRFRCSDFISVGDVDSLNFDRNEPFSIGGRL